MSVTDRLVSRLPMLGDRADARPSVAVVKLHGLITPASSPLARGVINIASTETALSRAFSHDRLAAVALMINSPGGAATQSALVADRIRELATKKNVPVLAFCEDLVASGGYWIACAADEIFAHSTSIVGSIGVVSRGFGMHGLLDRLGVERRLHTAGKHKARLDPFLPEDQDDVAWLTNMQEQLHELFVEWVRSRRGARLDTSADLFDGEVWTGIRATELGLVDGVGTLREIITKRFPDAEITTVEPRKPLLARLGFAPAASLGRLSTGASGDFALSLLEAAEQRAAWARFGL